MRGLLFSAFWKPMPLEEISPCGEKGRASLKALAERVEKAAGESAVGILGAVAEITASHIRIVGLSKFTKLGDWVLIETDQGGQIGEAIRIDAESILVRPFEDAHRAAIGARARI